MCLTKKDKPVANNNLAIALITYHDLTRRKPVMGVLRSTLGAEWSGVSSIQICPIYAQRQRGIVWPPTVGVVGSSKLN